MSYDVTPIYGIHKPTGMTTALELAAVLGQMVDTVEAALARGGIAPPEAQALAAVAGRVSTLEGAGPVDLGMVTNVSAHFGGQYQNARVWRAGKTVFLSGTIGLSGAWAANQEGQIATVPAGYRPAAKGSTAPAVPGGGIVMIDSASTMARLLRLDVHPDGRVMLANGGTAFAAGSYVPVAAHWNLS